MIDFSMLEAVWKNNNESGNNQKSIAVGGESVEKLSLALNFANVQIRMVNLPRILSSGIAHMYRTKTNKNTYINIVNLFCK